jgi:hypothetical protein
MTFLSCKKDNFGIHKYKRYKLNCPEKKPTNTKINLTYYKNLYKVILAELNQSIYKYYEYYE